MPNDPKTTLIRLCCPPIDNIFAFQVLNLDLNLSKIGYQLLIRAILRPIGTPRYLKGNKFASHPVTLAKPVVSPSKTLTPKKLIYENLSEGLKLHKKISK